MATATSASASPKSEPTAATTPKPRYLGTVVDEAGRGIVGVSVSLWRGGRAETRTDADGAFSLTGEEPRALLRARSDDRGWVAKDAVVWAAPDEPVHLVLVVARDLRIVVRGEDTKRPIAGARVRSVCGEEVTVDHDFARKALHNDEARTDADGRAVVRAPEGVARVYVDAAGWANASTEPARVGPQGLDLIVELGRAGSVSGRVVDPRGAEVADALVHAVGPGMYDARVRTDATGAFRLVDVPTRASGGWRGSEVNLSVREAADWAPTAARCDLPAPDGAVEVVVRLVPARTLRGRAVTRSGGALAGVTVYASPASTEWFATERLGDEAAKATSDDEGWFELHPVAPGGTRIDGRRANGWHFASADVTVPEEGELPPVTLREERSGSRGFAVRVEDVDGKPLAGTGVDALVLDDRDGKNWDRVGWEDTDSEGIARFADGLPEGPVHFIAHRDGWASCKIVADLTNPALREARIPYPSGGAQGRVRLRDGRPVSVKLRLRRLADNGDLGEWMTDCSDVATDEEGRFRLDALGGDAY